MYGPQLIEMAQVAEQEHMLRAVMARTRASSGARCASFVDRDGLPARGPRSGLPATSDRPPAPRRPKGTPTDLVPCTDC